jgi:hypothetical protein
MQNLEDLLRRYTKPSSDSEQQRQDAAEQLVRSAVVRRGALKDLGGQLEILPKGSYKNNTNVRLDSDVDVAVVSHQVFYSEYPRLSAEDQQRVAGGPPTTWLHPAEFRSELTTGLQAEAGSSKVHAGRIAIQVDAIDTRRTSVDAIPSYEFRRYYYRGDGSIGYHEGNVVYPTSGARIINWPEQQYANGVAKNRRTNMRYKQLVRILKNVENDLVAKLGLDELPSYFVECLVYNVPDTAFGHDTLTADTRSVLWAIFDGTQSTDKCNDWVEVNGLKWLFRSGQSWSSSQAHDLSLRAWQYLGLSSS